MNAINKKLQLPLDLASGWVWVCVSKQHNLLAKFSIASTKEESIAAFMDGATANWSYYEREHGWECVQITIQFHSK